MNRQAKYKPQAGSKFFADGRAGPAAGGRGGATRAHDRAGSGFSPRGQFPFIAARRPAASSRATFRRSSRWTKVHAARPERYTIYCAPCHGALGDGQGITKSYGMVTTASYHDDRIRENARGGDFNTITNGKNTMSPYADKLSPEDRWAVIAYVRALERARQGAVSDVPADHKADLGL